VCIVNHLQVEGAIRQNQ